MKLNLRLVLVPISLLFFSIGQVWALSLGNISVVSKPNEPFEARVNLKLSEQESKTLRSIEVKEGDDKAYQKLGISKLNNQDQFDFRVVSNSDGVPQYIQINTQKPIEESGKVFKDIVLEVKWPTGQFRRVYTILSDKSKSMQVTEGVTLSDLALRMQPDVGGANFDQTLIALYRANPQAFASGNIHRLKAGEVLRAPSAAMIKSIPLDESKNIADSIYQNFQSGQLSSSTEDVKPVQKAESAPPAKQSSGDRLSIGSSSNSDDVDRQLSNQIEELVAQEKILADAKQRIVQLEKNINDLKKLSAKSKSNEFYKEDGFIVKLLVGLVLLIVFALLTFILLNHRKSKVVIKPSSELDQVDLIQNSKESISEKNTVINTVSADRAKALFAGIDLNLDSPVRAPADRKIPSQSELRVKLNLAKSYMKIDDLVMAKLILDEIISSESDVINEIAREARNLRTKIAA